LDTLLALLGKALRFATVGEEYNPPQLSESAPESVVIFLALQDTGLGEIISSVVLVALYEV
jgi:hypothetical protein